MDDRVGDSSRNPNSRVAWEGCSVLLDINDGDRLVFARLSPSASVKIGNKRCPLRPLVGCPFGSVFQVETGPKGPYLVRVSSAPSTEDICLQEEDVGKLKVDQKDNRALLDDNKAQCLTSEDIDALRRGGASGNEIIEALIANSSTFEKKTVFSQEKYRLRKQKKYAPKVLLRRPFARSICEAYFKKHPTRIGFLRVDTLSLLLSLANVGAYSDILVVDMVGGILTGAVAERLGGTACVCSVYVGSTPYPMDIVRLFNFSSEIYRRIVQSPLSSLCFAQDGENEPYRSSELQSNSNGALIVSRNVLDNGSVLSLEEQNGKPISTMGVSSLCEHDSQSQVPVGMNGNNDAVVRKSVLPGRQASPDAIKSWKQMGFSSLIIAAPDLDAWSILQDLLPLLSYSAPFAIYHQCLQPLATCMHKLQAEKMAIALQISEPWLREYQVLPSRTHPLMQMSGSGGYILSGIRVCYSDNCH